MPIEPRFDDLDLREEPATARAPDGAPTPLTQITFICVEPLRTPPCCE
ncbi:MAG: hypothetical protein JO103_09040 [Candidatus Eremiobacteraeota bacterium]|nr:hypothetical protein [Candidatus Eremiobacteraeota bacterium]